MLKSSDKISIYRKFLSALTWQKFAQLFAFAVLTGVSIGTFENRDALYRYISENTRSMSYIHDYKVSQTSIDEISRLVHHSDIVIGIQITIVDFNKNTRRIVFTDMDDPELLLAYQRYIQKSTLEIPLFNSDVSNNIGISQLINGEFICAPYKGLSTFAAPFDASNIVSTICANGIPPYYGKFTGILTIYLKRPPSASELDQLKSSSKSLSLSIFERDFR